MELTMSMFATQADYWKARAEKAEKRGDAMAETVAALSDVVTSPHEGKDEFIARVRAVLSADPDERVAQLRSRLSAAEKERDEAIAYAEKMKAATGAVLRAHRLTIKRPAETMDKIENELEEIRRAAAMADEAVSTPAPAAIYHLRQEIIERCAKVCESTSWAEDITTYMNMTKRDIASRSMLACAAAIRRLAEEQEGKG